MEKVKESRSGVLDLCRIVATLLIILHHYQQVMRVSFDRINFYGGKRFYFGYMVELFFVISGILVYSYRDKIVQGLSFQNYIQKKYMRYFPILALTTLIFSLVALWIYHEYHIWYDGIEITLLGIVITMLGVQIGWGFEYPNINGQTWYLGVLLMCYIMFYLCVWGAKRLSLNVKYLFAGMILLGIGLFGGDLPFPLFQPVAGRGYVAFFSGVLLADYWKEHPNAKRILAAMFTTLFTLIIAFTEWAHADQLNMLSVFMGVIYYPLMIHSLKSPKMERIFSNKLVYRLSSISFEAYMWHSVVFMIINVLEYKFRISFDRKDQVIVCSCIILTYLVAILSYYCIELPISKRIEKMFGQAEAKDNRAVL